MLAIDVLERLIDFVGGEAGEKIRRQARRAIQDALREFVSHSWKYFLTHGRLQLIAGYSTGTVAYDSSTRQLTLTGGTWPAWAASGYVRINDVIARVATRTSNSVLVLDSTLTFSATIAAGTGYLLYQDTYPMPADFRATDIPIGENWWGQLQYVHPTDWLFYTRTAERTGRPMYFTFFPSQTQIDRYDAKVVPIPDETQTLDFIYHRRMRTIRYDGMVNPGKASITLSGTTVTGVGTSFTSDMVGSYIRLSSSTTPPTGQEGTNQYVFESKVTAYTSATQITVADAATRTLAAVAYVVSDPIDIEDPTMAVAFAALAQANLARGLRTKDVASIEEDAEKRLIKAREMDSRYTGPMQAGPSGAYYPGIRDLPSGPDE